MTVYPYLQPMEEVARFYCHECSYWGQDLDDEDKALRAFATCFCGPKMPAVYRQNGACQYFLEGDNPVNRKLRVMMGVG